MADMLRDSNGREAVSDDDESAAACIYLDYNATTPCDPDVVLAMLPFFGERGFGALAPDRGVVRVSS